LSFVSNNKDEDEDSIDQISALNLIRDTSIQTLANQQIQNVIQQRISIYPQFIINNHLHKTISYLPNHIALALSIDHTLISDAIQAFYLRDPQSLLVSTTFILSFLLPSITHNHFHFHIKIRHATKCLAFHLQLLL
jgi:hypothetical protein